MLPGIAKKHGPHWFTALRYAGGLPKHSASPVARGAIISVVITLPVMTLHHAERDDYTDAKITRESAHFPGHSCHGPWLPGPSRSTRAHPRGARWPVRWPATSPPPPDARGWSGPFREKDADQAAAAVSSDRSCSFSPRADRKAEGTRSKKRARSCKALIPTKGKEPCSLLWGGAKFRRVIHVSMVAALVCRRDRIRRGPGLVPGCAVAGRAVREQGRGPFRQADRESFCRDCSPAESQERLPGHRGGSQDHASRCPGDAAKTLRRTPRCQRTRLQDGRRRDGCPQDAGRGNRRDSGHQERGPELSA